MKLAITAASGQLGASIVKATVALTSKNDVIALARTPEKAAALDVEVRPGDYNNQQALEESLEGVDCLLLVSGMDAPEKRVEQHRNVIQAAVHNKVKKIVYTSIQGAEIGTAFSPVVQSNRQTETDIKNSGLDWTIGRNGIYIEPDIEYIDSYIKQGGIFNCAADGKCAYTTRDELAYAYAKLLTENKHNKKTYNLHGELLSQYQLADYLSQTYSAELCYKPMSVEAYKQDRIAELGDFMGTVIAGIYQGIREGKVANHSDYRDASGRDHIHWRDYFSQLQKNVNNKL